MKRVFCAGRRAMIAGLCFGALGFGAKAEIRATEFAQVETAAGVLRFPVEIADDSVERNRGLSNRDYLAPGTGMLFVFQRPWRARFWMKDTRIPLDIIFADSTGRVVMIAANMVPYSLESVGPGDIPVALVLELNGGEAARYGIAVGDRLSRVAAAN